MTTTLSPGWHNRIVTDLLFSACGDLALDNWGDLTTKITYDYDTLLELPKGQFRHGPKLAKITPNGWTLLPEGAQWIIENCPPDSRSKYELARPPGHGTGEVSAHRIIRRQERTQTA